jgi:hypothetical protein
MKESVSKIKAQEKDSRDPMISKTMMLKLESKEEQRCFHIIWETCIKETLSEKTWEIQTAYKIITLDKIWVLDQYLSIIEVIAGMERKMMILEKIMMEMIWKRTKTKIKKAM